MCEYVEIARAGRNKQISLARVTVLQSTLFQ